MILIDLLKKIRLKREKKERSLYGRERKLSKRLFRESYNVSKVPGTEKEADQRKHGNTAKSNDNGNNVESTHDYQTTATSESSVSDTPQDLETGMRIDRELEQIIVNFQELDLRVDEFKGTVLNDECDNLEDELYRKKRHIK